MRRILAALLLCLLGSNAYAACGTIPWTFVNSTLADANQVNANFQALLNCFNVAGIFAGPASITNTTASTTNATGSLINAGGTGLQGQVNIGRDTADWGAGGFVSATFGLTPLTDVQLAVLNSRHANPSIFATESTNAGGFGYPSEALTAVAVNNWPSSSQTVWAIYAETVKPATAHVNSISITQENDANCLFNACTALYPSFSSTQNGNFINLWLASGGSAAGTKYDISAYIATVNNGAKAFSGMLILCGSVRTTNPTFECSDAPGTSEGIGLFNQMGIDWYAFGGTTPVAILTGSISSAGPQTTVNINPGYLSVNVPATLTKPIAIGRDAAATTKNLITFQTSDPPSSATDSAVIGGGGSDDIRVQAGATGLGRLGILGTTIFTWGASGPAFNTIPTSAGAGGIYVCIDTAGTLYKKPACP